MANKTFLIGLHHNNTVPKLLQSKISLHGSKPKTRGLIDSIWNQRKIKLHFTVVTLFLSALFSVCFISSPSQLPWDFNRIVKVHYQTKQIVFQKKPWMIFRENETPLWSDRAGNFQFPAALGRTLHALISSWLQPLPTPAVINGSPAQLNKWPWH